MTIKRVLYFALCVFIGFSLLVLPARAEDAASDEASGFCGEGLAWHLQDDILTISGEGEMVEYENDNEAGFTSWTQYMKQIKTVVIEEGVTSISNYAFYRADHLEKITIPESVTYIGSRAFSGCEALQEIILPAGVTEIGKSAFVNCFKLKEISLPESLETVGDRAFSGCSLISEVIIPDSVLYIGEQAFNSCRSLTRVSIGKGTETIGEEAFAGDFSLEDITVDPDNAFYTSVDGVLFDKEMKTLVQYPAGNTRSKYSIPEGVEKLENRVFCGARLTELTIPTSLEYIGKEAIEFMISLEKITVDEENQVFTSVDDVLFDKDMTCLLKYPSEKTGNSYAVPEGVISIADNAFDYCSILKELTLPERLESIGDSSFFSCSNITDFVIPDSVSEIGPMAFMYCESMKSIQLPAGLKSLQYCTFDTCRSLESITIPESVDAIDWGVFGMCYHLTKVVFEGSAPVFDPDAFKNAKVTVLYPDNDESWVKAVEKDYGGNVVWTAYQPDASADDENEDKHKFNWKWPVFFD